MMRKKQRKKTGSALILVIIVTVLLSVVGIMFVMTSRIREMTTSNFADDRDLDTAVGAVTEQIDTVLMQDLFGTNLTAGIIDDALLQGNEACDSTNSDPWLASLEPSQDIIPVPAVNTDADPTNDWYQWGHMTTLYNTAPKWDGILRDGQYTPWFQIAPWDISKKEYGGIVEDYQEFTFLIGGKQTPLPIAQIQGLPADADGDGVADSIWERVSDISTSRGRPVFAAVRIIDNCAMLNLNTAFGFYQKPTSMDPRHWSQKPWCTDTLNWTPYCNIPPYGDNIGRYLSEVNFSIFLRAFDVGRPQRIQFARDTQARIRGGLVTTDPYYYPYNMQADDYHNKAAMNIGSSNLPFSFFDISDELEIRNRFLLTSKSNSRFEKRDPQEQAHANALPSIILPPPANAYQGIAYQTFDFEQGRDVPSSIDNWSQYFEVRVAAIPFTLSDFGQWKKKMNPALFDSYPYPNPPAQTPYCEYDRRHLCTFYSFDRNIRSGIHGRLDDAIDALSLPPFLLSDLQRQAVEEIFRPLKNQPVDLRVMTDPANPDNIIIPDPAIDPVSGLPEHIINAHRNILHLLYAFREKEYEAWGAIGGGYDPNALAPSARKAAQQVANMIDFLDDTATATTGPFGMCCPPYGPYGLQKNCDPTYIKRAFVRQMILDVCNDYNTKHPTTPIPVIDIDLAAYSAFDFDLAATEVFYGYERQPFISEVYCNNDSSGTQVFALELVNPYENKYAADGITIRVPGKIDLNGWRLCFGTSGTKCDLGSACVIPAALPGTQNGRLIIWTANTGYSAPAITSDAIYNRIISSATANGINDNTTFGLGTPMQLPGNELCLQRPDPANPGQFITVDSIDQIQRQFLIVTPPPGPVNSINVSSRDDNDWKFSNRTAYVNNNPQTLGAANNVNAAPKGYQLPVDNANTHIDRLADFQKITWVDPNGLTGHIATVSDEGKIRYDSQVDTELLHYVCTLGRGEKGIPGRININTAPLHVIAAAIPPQLIMSSGDPNTALDLAQGIINKRPYTTINDLLNVDLVKKYATINPAIVGDVSIHNDFEKRDWIFNRLSNIFTVRSDTFTAYILVRLGVDGPQRRMIAIFDRSNCWTATDQPKLVALHPVPDPR